MKGRRICYAVTKRGSVEALIDPVDAGERLLGQADLDTGWGAWQTLVEQRSKKSEKRTSSAAAELDQMRRYRAALVTLDRQRLERGSAIVPTLSPADFLVTDKSEL